jgi:hypothetical protein
MARTLAVKVNQANTPLLGSGNNTIFGIYVLGSSLGSGTLSLHTRAQGDTNGEYAQIDTAIPLGSNFRYEVLNNIEVSFTLSGSSSADFTIIATTG